MVYHLRTAVAADDSEWLLWLLQYHDIVRRSWVVAIHIVTAAPVPGTKAKPNNLASKTLQ